MSENYVDFNTFLLNNNIFNGTPPTSSLNVNANEFVPQNITEPSSAAKPIPNNYGNRRSRASGTNANNRYNHNHRTTKRNDFWNKNRENASSSSNNNTLQDKNQESAKVTKFFFSE